AHRRRPVAGPRPRRAARRARAPHHRQGARGVDEHRRHRDPGGAGARPVRGLGRARAGGAVARRALGGLRGRERREPRAAARERRLPRRAPARDAAPRRRARVRRPARPGELRRRLRRPALQHRRRAAPRGALARRALRPAAQHRARARRGVAPGRRAASVRADGADVLHAGGRWEV
ncbi:MAG: 16S rRNA (guanine(966)-N(2))-methyltransferase, partial [uncultured Gemmatimonadaceae bacterium]